MLHDTYTAHIMFSVLHIYMRCFIGCFIFRCIYCIYIYLYVHTYDIHTYINHRERESMIQRQRQRQLKDMAEIAAEMGIQRERQTERESESERERERERKKTADMLGPRVPGSLSQEGLRSNAHQFFREALGLVQGFRVQGSKMRCFRIMASMLVWGQEVSEG